MWTMSCIFHNVPTVTLWQLLGRETMQETFSALRIPGICFIDIFGVCMWCQIPLEAKLWYLLSTLFIKWLSILSGQLTVSKQWPDFYGIWYTDILLHPVLWRCWLGGRNGTRSVKNWVVGCWRGYLSGARCRFAYGPADATATHCLLLE